MRLVNIDQVTEEMTLAKPLYDSRGMLILPLGSALMPHREQLTRLNVQHLHVNDRFSEGIEMSHLLSEDTRIEIYETVRKLKQIYKRVEDHKKKTFYDFPYMKLGKKITEDIMSQGGVNIDITELVMNRIYDHDHELNVGILSALIGRAFGMTSDNVFNMCLGGFLHDIGLLALPEEIMAKFGKTPMDAVDLMTYRQYPMMGFDMVRNNQVLNIMTKSAMLQHKERFDGTGFPGKKQGDEISQAAKIVAVANSFEKHFFGRDPEHGEMNVLEVVKYILKSTGSAYDPAVVQEFVRYLVIFPNGTTVKLSDGSTAVVESQNAGKMVKPVVRVIGADNKSWERLDLVSSNLSVENMISL